jgi:hypothetical protein
MNTEMLSCEAICRRESNRLYRELEKRGIYYHNEN